MRLIFDNQFKILFDEPIQVTKDNVGQVMFLITGLETSIRDDPKITVGPRRPDLKDITHISDENNNLEGLLFTFERGLVKTGQIGLSSSRIKKNVANQMKINDFDVSTDEITIESVDIFR